MKTIARFALATVALASGSMLPTLPASAQRNTNVLIVYGNDPCPTSNGEEITVCARRPEGDRYRIPPQFRKTDPLYNQTWADRAQSIEYAGASGTMSCSPAGSGGTTGCMRQIQDRWRAERQQIAEDAPVIEP